MIEIDDDPRDVALAIAEFVDSHPSQESPIGKALPGPLSVYGPVTEWNWRSALGLLLPYRASYIREFVKLWKATTPKFRRMVEEEYAYLRDTSQSRL
jgi:hypothetical protein